MISDTDMDVVHVLRLRKSGGFRLIARIPWGDGIERNHMKLSNESNINSVSYAGDLQLPQSWQH
jgi:hypothetical protein